MEDREQQMQEPPRAADWGKPNPMVEERGIDDGAILKESPHFRHDMDDGTIDAEAEEQVMQPSRADIEAAHVRMAQEKANRETEARHERAMEIAKREAGEREKQAEERSRQEARTAQRIAHPHYQLRTILTDLRDPRATAGDSSTKYAYLHSAVVRLTQLVLSHTPAPPEDDDGERIDGRERRELAEGTGEQEPSMLRQQHETGQAIGEQ